MDPDVGEVVAKPPDACSRDELTVVELDPLEVVAADQVVERCVRDQGQIVQLKDGQVLRRTGRHAQLADPLVRHQLTVGQADKLQPRAARRQDGQGGVSQQHTF